MSKIDTKDLGYPLLCIAREGKGEFRMKTLTITSTTI